MINSRGREKSIRRGYGSLLGLVVGLRLKLKVLVRVRSLFPLVDMLILKNRERNLEY